MYLDFENLYCNKQQVLASAASENIIDHEVVEIGPGEPIEVIVQVTEDFDAGPLTVALETSEDEAFTTPVVLQTTADIDQADLTAGYQFSLSTVPIHMLRYSRLNITVGGAPTTGAIMAGLAIDRQYGFCQP